MHCWVKYTIKVKFHLFVFMSFNADTSKFVIIATHMALILWLLDSSDLEKPPHFKVRT